MTFSWMKGRGVLPSQWLENHPQETDILFAIRQAFYPDWKLGNRFRAHVGFVWLSHQHLGILGRVQEPVRIALLQRFRDVERDMGLVSREEDRGEFS